MGSAKNTLIKHRDFALHSRKALLKSDMVCDARGSMVNDLETFYDSLPKDKVFKSKLEIVEDEKHISMMPIAPTKGLKYLFGK